VVLLSYKLSHLRTVVPGLTMAAVMQSSCDPVANKNSSPPAKQLATTGNTVTFQGSGAADS